MKILALVSMLICLGGWLSWLFIVVPVLPISTPWIVNLAISWAMGVAVAHSIISFKDL